MSGADTKGLESRFDTQKAKRLETIDRRTFDPANNLRLCIPSNWSFDTNMMVSTHARLLCLF